MCYSSAEAARVGLVRECDFFLVVAACRRLRPTPPPPSFSTVLRARMGNPRGVLEERGGWEVWKTRGGGGIGGSRGSGAKSRRQLLGVRCTWRGPDTTRLKNRRRF